MNTPWTGISVAELYGVSPREIKQAVRNNPNKFLEWCVFEFDRQEFADLRLKFLIANNLAVLKLKHTLKRKDKN